MLLLQNAPPWPFDLMRGSALGNVKTALLFLFLFSLLPVVFLRPLRPAETGTRAVFPKNYTFPT